MKPIVLSVIGTRPEAIKMAPVLALYQKSSVFRCRILLSGQHVHVPEEILSSMGVVLKEAKNLALLTEGAPLGDFFARALAAFEAEFALSPPDALAVHGDTASAAAGALAAFHRRIPVFHIEAGLRTHDINAPYPEELYRVLIDRLSALCFAPTEIAKTNLLSEGIAKEKIFVTGNTGIDALRRTVQKDFFHPILKAAGERKRLLITVHRRENTTNTYERILRAIRSAAKKRQDTFFLFVTHPNPNLRQAAYTALHGQENIFLSKPLSHTVFQNLLARTHLLLSDSGGLQEEACALGIPTLVLRDKTERPEGIGMSLIPIGTEENAIIDAIDFYLSHLPVFPPSNCFGDGHAAQRILEHTEHYFCKQ